MYNIKFNDKTKARKVVDVILIVAIFALCLITVIATGNAGRKEQKASTEAESTVQPAPETEIASEVQAELTDEPADEPIAYEEAVSSDTASEPQNEQAVILPPPEFSKPVSGRVMRAFSIDEPLYSLTMDDWRIHSGVDIASQRGSDVTSAESGTVEFCGYDDRLGYTVIVARGEYQCIYSSLESSLPVSVGQEVFKGEIIGQTGSSLISEICDESHLHFEMKINGEYVNPQDYINFD